MSYLETITLLKSRQKKDFNGIPTLFESLKEVLPSWDHRDSIIVFAATGTGKTNFVWKHAVLDVVSFIKNQSKIKVHIHYFSLELSRHEMYMKLFSSLLKEAFNKTFTRDYMLGYLEERMTNEEFFLLEYKSKEMLEFLDNHVTIYDEPYTPDQAYLKLCETIPKDLDEDTYNIVIIDTVNAFTANSGENKTESIKKWNQDYALKGLRNNRNCTVINIMQQDFDSSKRAFTNKGESINEKYVPTLESLGNDKESSRSARLVLSIFNPQTYKIKEWGTPLHHALYNVEKFNGGLRFVYVNKNNFGDNILVVPYFFDGASNIWTEIKESPVDFRTNPALYEKYTKNKKSLSLFT